MSNNSPVARGEAEMLKQIIGPTGSAISGACCLGFTPFLAGLSSIGAGFLINDRVLIPLFVLFLGITLWGLRSSRRHHGRSGPVVLGVVASLVAFAALWFLVPLAYAGLAALVAASAWDIVLLRRSVRTNPV
jgi:hypothetical protein